MSFGSLYLDFHDPIMITNLMKEQKALHGADFDPMKNKKDRQFFNNRLGYKLVYQLQGNIMIMPTTLVATVLLLYRKGISEENLLTKIMWLGMACI